MWQPGFSDGEMIHERGMSCCVGLVGAGPGVCRRLGLLLSDIR
jgi:hypothetical protein